MGRIGGRPFVGIEVGAALATVRRTGEVTPYGAGVWRQPGVDKAVVIRAQFERSTAPRASRMEVLVPRLAEKEGRQSHGPPIIRGLAGERQEPEIVPCRAVERVGL